jgi:hypothetical protein
MTWDDAVAYALSLPDTELGASYGKPAVKVVSNDRAFLFPGHEADSSFGIAMDRDTIDLLKETEPETYWQTPHYEGWPGILVRYDAKDGERVREVIRRSRDWTAARPKTRPRKPK